jgi:hypothetical protein
MSDLPEDKRSVRARERAMAMQTRREHELAAIATKYEITIDRITSQDSNRVTIDGYEFKSNPLAACLDFHDVRVRHASDFAEILGGNGHAWAVLRAQSTLTTWLVFTVPIVLAVIVAVDAIAKGDGFGFLLILLVAGGAAVPLLLAAVVACVVSAVRVRRTKRWPQQVANGA